MKRLSVLTAGAVVATLLLFVPQAASASGYDYTDPVATGCASGAYVVASSNALDNLNQVEGYVELVYSPACGTNWVNAYDYSDMRLDAGLVRLGEPSGPGVQIVGPGTSEHTAQLDAPGSTCVRVGWSLHDYYTGTDDGAGSFTVC